MAPALIALTAFSVSTYAVINSTTLLGLCARIFSSHSYPSSPLMASRWKFISSMMTSGMNESIIPMIRSGVLITLIPSTYGFKSILSDKRTSSLSSTISIFPFFSIAIIFNYFAHKVTAKKRDNSKNGIISSKILNTKQLSTTLSRYFKEKAMIFPKIFGDFKISFYLCTLVIKKSRG